MSSFRERLKAELAYKGLLQKELAALTGISKRTLDSYLGVREAIPSAEQIVKIAQALEVSVEYLITGKEKHSNLTARPEARKLLSLFSILDECDQQTVLTMVESMASRYANDGKKGKSSSHAG